MKITGPLLIALAVINTISLWILSKHDPSFIFLRPFKSLGQIAGLVGATLISLQFLLSARFNFVEKLFGGLDKVYKAHSFAGALGFILALNHPFLLAINALPSTQTARMFFWPAGNLGYTLGLSALYLLALLLLITLYARLPYHLWKYSHALMVLPLGLTFFHMLKVSSDVSAYGPLRFWMLGLSGLSLAAYIYKKFLYQYFGPAYSYRISSVTRKLDVTELILKPLGRRLRFLPGQFVFLSICDRVVSEEEHPFSISSSPHKESLRLSIKSAGDYTKKLPLLKAGAPVKLYGPYGSFAERSLTTGKDNIWIAGGIGITPFLSLLNYYQSSAISKNIWLFYSSKNEADAVYLNEISASSGDKIKFLHRPTQKAGRLDADQIQKAAGSLKDKLILMCGPRAMMDNLYGQFLMMGVKPRNIIFEEFNFT